MDWNSVWRRFGRALVVTPLFLLGFSSPASAIVGMIIIAVLLYWVALLVRMAFISKYILMLMIVLNPCIVADPTTGTCNPYQIGTFTIAFPEDQVVKQINLNLLGMFQGFYVVAILYYAVYVIFMSASPSGRARGKQMLMTLLVGMVIVSQSRQILQLAMEISNGIAYSMIDIANSRLAALGTLGVMAKVEMCILDMLFVSVGLVAILIAGVRFFFVLLMAAFFPLTLFLYFIPFTKNYGLLLLRFTVLVVFVQVIQALLYSVTIISAVDETGIAGFIISIGGLFGVIYSPLLAMKLMGWLGGVTHMYSTRAGGAGTRFVAMLMRGQSVGTAFQTAGAQYMIAHNMGPMMRGMPSAQMPAAIPIPGTGGAHAPVGYGIRSARSFRGRVEGHSGGGASFGASMGGPAAGVGAPTEGFYVAEGSRGERISKTMAERVAGGVWGAAAAGDAARAIPRSARGGMPSMPAGRAAKPALPMGQAPSAGSAVTPILRAPARGAVAGGGRAAGAAAGAAAKPSAKPGAAVGGAAVAAAGAARAAAAAESVSEAKTIEQAGTVLEEKEREALQKAPEVKPKSRRELDELAQKHREEMFGLRAKSRALKEEVKKAGVEEPEQPKKAGKPDMHHMFEFERREEKPEEKKEREEPGGEDEKKKKEKSGEESEGE